jgi:hypothetical protein
MRAGINYGIVRAGRSPSAGSKIAVEKIAVEGAWEFAGKGRESG